MVCVTEGIPVRDMARVASYLRGKASTLVGPNCPGVISPGRSNVGIIPGEICAPGRVGLVSRSGTLTYQIVHELTQRGIGQSTCVGMGGDPVHGIGFLESLALFNRDPETDLVVMIGEIGGDDEERAAEYVAQEMTKPVIGYIAGFTAPPGKRMGHAGAIVTGSRGTAQAKADALEAAGVPGGPHAHRGRRPRPDRPAVTEPAAASGSDRSPLATGWRAAVRHGLLAFGAVVALAEAAALAVYALGGTGLSLASALRTGGFYVAAFHRVPLRLTAEGDGLRRLVDVLGGAARTAEVRAEIAIAPLAATALAGWLLWRGGRAVAETMGGGPLARALHGAKVAPRLRRRRCSWSAWRSASAVPLLEGSATPGSADLAAAPLPGLVLPLAARGAWPAPRAAGGPPAGRDALARPGRRSPAGGRCSSRGSRSRTRVCSWPAWYGPTAPRRSSRPRPAGTSRRSSSARRAGAVVLVHHLALAPNEAAWVLVPAMGGCTGSFPDDGRSERFLCYGRFPQDVAIPAWIRAPSATAGPVATTRFGTAPGTVLPVPARAGGGDDAGREASVAPCGGAFRCPAGGLGGRDGGRRLRGPGRRGRVGGLDLGLGLAHARRRDGSERCHTSRPRPAPRWAARPGVGDRRRCGRGPGHPPFSEGSASATTISPTRLITTPTMSIIRAVFSSASRFTSHAMRPPSHPSRIGSSHHAPFTGRVARSAGLHPPCCHPGAAAPGAAPAPIPTSAWWGSHPTYAAQAWRQPSSVLGNRRIGAPGWRPVPDAEEVGPVAEQVPLPRVAELQRLVLGPRSGGGGLGAGGERDGPFDLRDQHGAAVAALDRVVLDLLGAVGAGLHGGTRSVPRSRPDKQEPGRDATGFCLTCA